MNYAAMKKAMKAKHANNMPEIIALCVLLLSIGFVAACVVAYIL